LAVEVNGNYGAQQDKTSPFQQKFQKKLHISTGIP